MNYYDVKIRQTKTLERVVTMTIEARCEHEAQQKAFDREDVYHQRATEWEDQPNSQIDWVIHDDPVAQLKEVKS